MEWSSDGGLGNYDDRAILTSRTDIEPATGKLPLAGATALATKFLFKSSKGPQRPKKSLRNVENDRRRRDVAHLHNSHRYQPPSAPSYHPSHRSPRKAGRHQTREYSSSSQNSSVSSQSSTYLQSRDSSIKSGRSRRGKKPIKDEKGYDSGYASGSDQTSPHHYVRRGPRWPLETARRSN